MHIAREYVDRVSGLPDIETPHPFDRRWMRRAVMRSGVLGECAYARDEDKQRKDSPRGRHWAQYRAEGFIFSRCGAQGLRELRAGRRLPWGLDMSKHEPDNHQDDERWADIRSRFGDIYEKPEREPGKGRWAKIKDRLAIVAVILVLALLGFMMVDGSIVNFRCTFAEFVTFECNRWAGEEHPSLRQ